MQSLKIKHIVHWLRTEDEADHRWRAQIDTSARCLAEMVTMMATLETAERTEPITDDANHLRMENLDRAVLHVRTMAKAMRDRDRATALTHGEMASQWLLQETGPHPTSAPPTPAIAASARGR